MIDNEFLKIQWMHNIGYKEIFEIFGYILFVRFFKEYTLYSYPWIGLKYHNWPTLV